MIFVVPVMVTIRLSRVGLASGSSGLILIEILLPDIDSTVPLTLFTSPDMFIIIPRCGDAARRALAAFQPASYVFAPVTPVVVFSLIIHPDANVPMVRPTMKVTI